MATTSIIGTEEKFNVRVAPIGDIHAMDYGFSIKVYSNKQASLIISKDDVIFVDADTFTILVDTSALGVGVIVIEVTAYIPDEDFPDKLRTEIARYITDTQIIA